MCRGGEEEEEEVRRASCGSTARTQLERVRLSVHRRSHQCEEEEVGGGVWGWGRR